MSLCQRNIDCLECNARGMCNSYALFKYKQGFEEAIKQVKEKGRKIYSNNHKEDYLIEISAKHLDSLKSDL